MEGYRAGTYIRLELQGVPCELVANFDPRFPILVGGLGQAEEAVGYMTVSLSRAYSIKPFRCRVCDFTDLTRSPSGLLHPCRVALKICGRLNPSISSFSRSFDEKF
jgi:hypothetical protein